MIFIALLILTCKRYVFKKIEKSFVAWKFLIRLWYEVIQFLSFLKMRINWWNAARFILLKTFRNLSFLSKSFYNVPEQRLRAQARLNGSCLFDAYIMAFSWDFEPFEIANFPASVWREFRIICWFHSMIIIYICWPTYKLSKYKIIHQIILSIQMLNELFGLDLNGRKRKTRCRPFYWKSLRMCSVHLRA